MRRSMVVGEIAAAVVLLLATAVLVRNVRQLERLDPGFTPDGVFQAQVSIPPTYRTPDDVARFYERLSEGLAAAPGVKRIGVISIAPLSGLLGTVPFAVAGRSTAERDRISANIRIISPGYPAAAGTRVLQGRPFAETDRHDAPHVALVSAALADRVLSGSALGQRLLINDNNTGPRPVEIVGVVGNVRQAALDLPPSLDIYLPLRQVHPDGVSMLWNNQFWMIATDTDPAAFRETFLANVRAVDPDAAVSGAGSMRRFVDASLGPRRFTLGLFAAFAATTVLIAAVGLYGLVSYAVGQRTREIGLRMAIGATQGDVQRMMLREAVTLGLVGAAAGIGVGAIVRPAIATLGTAIGLRAGDGALMDPVAVAGVSSFLVALVLLAAWLPARRAARIEPSIVLK